MASEQMQQVPELETLPYLEARKIYPRQGKHIYAQYTDDLILVYQAFNPEIAAFAVENQKFFGAPGYSPTRMTWIKPNFLWCMYRAGWATKKNQERILGIWLKRSAFDRILREAVLSRFEPEVYETRAEYNALVSEAKAANKLVRLQWDPDHSPSGAKHPLRRAIQLGCKGWKTRDHDIAAIVDMTPFVREQHKNVDPSNEHAELQVPVERYYPVEDETLRHRLYLSKPPVDGQEELLEVGEAGEEGES